MLAERHVPAGQSGAAGSPDARAQAEGAAEEKPVLALRLHGPEDRGTARNTGTKGGTLSIVSVRDGAAGARATPADATQRAAPTLRLEIQAPTAPAREYAPGSALACYQLARESVAIADYEARELCLGSSSIGPAVCARAALGETLLENYRTVELCACARSAAPVRCYQRAQEDPTLSDLERVRLCSPAAGRARVHP